MNNNNELKPNNNFYEKKLIFILSQLYIRKLNLFYFEFYSLNINCKIELVKIF